MRRYLLILVLLVTSSISSTVARATVTVEKKWDPLAASYLTMLFLGDLTPVPWDKIRTAFEEPLAAAEIPVSADQHLMTLLPRKAAKLSADITTAIDLKDRQGLYQAASRALATPIYDALFNASGALNDPVKARNYVLTAQQLYRAIAPFISQSDPDNARTVGRAWLTLTSTAGSTGVFGIGEQKADFDRFDAARDTITDYIKLHYLPNIFGERASLTPVPGGVKPAKIQPIYKASPWFPPGTDIADQDPLPLLVLNFEEKGIDETDLPLVAYGDMLFDSPEIFGARARSLGISCATCHNRGDVNNRFFIPGVSHRPGGADVDGGFFNPLFNDFKDDALDTPSLRGIRFTAPYGRDGRIASLREFTRNVIVSEFAGSEPTPFMLDALVAYLTEFDFLPNSLIDRFGDLTNQADDAAFRGKVLFNTGFKQLGGKSCASCHVPSTNFTDNRPYDIGSDGNNYENSRGGQFETPTLINVAFTAPYFHDGSLPTLASVVDWFNDEYSLRLNARQRADLTAYVTAVGGADEPYEVFDDKNTPFSLAFAELTTFATTLEMLIPARDRFHADLMLRTVITDLRQDISTMSNREGIGQVVELADQLELIQGAIKREDWKAAGDAWWVFKSKKAAYESEMY